MLLFICFLTGMKCTGPVTPKSSLNPQHAEYPTGYKVTVKCDKGHVLKSVGISGRLILPSKAERPQIKVMGLLRNILENVLLNIY